MDSATSVLTLSQDGGSKIWSLLHSGPSSPHAKLVVAWEHSAGGQVQAGMGWDGLPTAREAQPGPCFASAPAVGWAVGRVRVHCSWSASLRPG